MMRRRYEQQLSLLNRELVQMGSFCEDLISSTLTALQKKDDTVTEHVRTLGADLDQMEKQIESLCLKILLQQQPVASDLRLVSSAMKMITDMERIGDQAEDIVEIIRTMKPDTVQGHSLIQSMASTAGTMVSEAVDAFVRQDTVLAEKIIVTDDVVDDLFVRYRNSLIQTILEDPEKGDAVLDGLMIAKYFERIADHATNLAEWVVFAVTGSYKGEDLE